MTVSEKAKVLPEMRACARGREEEKTSGNPGAPGSATITNRGTRAPRFV